MEILKKNVSCAISGIHLLNIFETLGQVSFVAPKLLWNGLTTHFKSNPPPHHNALPTR